jgi:hypothetical protein
MAFIALSIGWVEREAERRRFNKIDKTVFTSLIVRVFFFFVDITALQALP